MLKSARAAMRQEWTRLGAGIEPTRTVLIFCLLVMIPRYRAFAIGTPLFNQHIVLQLIAPVVIILVVYRESPLEWGAGLGDVRTGLALTALFLLLYLPGFFAMVSDDRVAAYYKYAHVARSFDWHAWGAKRMVSLLTMTRTEFFYRGFLLFGLRKKLNMHTAIMVHLIPYGIAHLGKPELECYGSLLVGYFLGYLALRVRSVWYGVFLHWFFSSAFQLYFVAKVL